MYYPAQLVLKSYKPLQLEKGMWFVQKLNVGHRIKEEVTVFALDTIPKDQDQFILENGYPVEPYIIGEDDKILAKPEQIGWFDAGEDKDDLYDITLKEINIILNDYDGNIEIDGDLYGHSSDEFDYPEDIFMPDLVQDKVVISFPLEEEEEYEEYLTNQDVWENGEVKHSRPYPYEEDVVEHLVLLDDELFYIHTDLDNNLKNPDDDAETVNYNN
jgi:hypothetical protein